MKILNHTIIKFSGYSYCISFDNIIQNIVICNKENIEIVSHYDLLPQLLNINIVRLKLKKLNMLDRNDLSDSNQILSINSIIFKKYIILKSINSIKLEKSIYYIGCHIRMGDNCMSNNKKCKIQSNKIKKIAIIYNRTCGNKNCRLVISSDSMLFISLLKKHIPNLITFKEEFDIIHSSGLNYNRNYSKKFYEKIIGDINILTKSDYLILSPRSTFSLLILYNNKKVIDSKSNYTFYEGNKVIYDPLYNVIKKSKIRCSVNKTIINFLNI